MLVPVVIVGGIVAWLNTPEGPGRTRARAEAAARAGNWSAALKYWRAFNQTRFARGPTHLGEARACLALGRAAQAMRALARSTDADPSNPEPWRLMLELLRVEDRITEARQLGWEASAAVPSSARREVLRDLTLALLADVPDDLARSTLERWIAADPTDLDAQAALSQRISAAPRPGDPGRAERIARLTALVDQHPDLPTAREALITALADAGESDRGRRLLDRWPPHAQDARYWRLRGRWDLDEDHQPARAVASFERALADLPHDWKTYSRLARALQMLNQPAAARQAAETVNRLREALDPAALGPRLNTDLARLDDQASLLDLADLCARVGLNRLAEAWRREAEGTQE